MHKQPFAVDDFTCQLPAGPGWRGHIDRGGWQRLVKVSLPADLDGAPLIEVETSIPSDPAIIWSDGALDWGKKATANRARFTRENLVGSREVTVIAPSRVRTHVMVG
jgi:hypothetical protein